MKADLTGYALQCREEMGLFQLQITRLKDNAPDLDFLVTEQWRTGPFEVVLTTAPDEQIGLAQIMWISRCTCTPRTVRVRPGVAGAPIGALLFVLHRGPLSL